MIADGEVLLSEQFDDGRWTQWITTGRSQIDRALGPDWAERFEYASSGSAIKIVSPWGRGPTDQERVADRNEDVNAKLAIARAALLEIQQELERLGAVPQPTSLPPRVFTKVQNAAVRSIAERDYEELRRSIATVKAAALLAGSVVEAVLFDALEQRGFTPKQLRDMRLADLVDEAVSSNVIKQRARSAGHAVREARNFVHPAVELEEGRLRKVDAEAAIALMQMVLEDVL